MTLRPVLLGLQPSFGFGDRLGFATPGHVAALRAAGGDIQPIFPQQSIREMARTQRTPPQVMRDALDGMKTAGWTGMTGADADHLKTPADVDVTASAGFTFFTIDPSGFVDQHVDRETAEVITGKFRAIADQIPWLSDYAGKSIQLATGTTLEFRPGVVERAAVKYGAAISNAISLAKEISATCERLGQPHEIELSVDETEHPTTLEEHWIIADQCLRGGMKLVSLAPRFIGEFEKGVDFKGSLAVLEKSLDDHAAIAEQLGPYKLSLHSGSDKLSMYPALARATRGRFHVKTAGTSYLEALRVVARHDARLFRRIITFARSRYITDKATYHVSATLDSAPAEEHITSDNGLERIYLECWSDVRPGRGFTNPGRQILHCTFGSVLTDPELGAQVRELVARHADAYTAVLEDHFSRHLRALSQ